MMHLSPSHYIFSEASSKFMEVALLLGDDYLNILMSSLESNVTRNVTKSFDCVKIMTNLMNLECLVNPTLPEMSPNLLTMSKL
jgi:hypothetical protein